MPTDSTTRRYTVTLGSPSNWRDLLDQDQEINAFLEVNRDAPVSNEGPLSGLRFGVKEAFEQEGRLTPLGVSALANRRGKTTAKTVSSTLAAGAKLIGTTRSTKLSIVGDSGTRNPLDLTRTPGGSSSGSAAACAAGFVDFALSTQAVGSIVRPASYCGVPGFKPSRNALSLEGVMCLAAELDHVGIIARDVETLSQVFKTLSGLDLGSNRFSTVYVPKLWFDVVAHPAADLACDILSRKLAELGMSIFPIQIPEEITSGESGIVQSLVCKGLFDNHLSIIEAHKNTLPKKLMEMAIVGGTISKKEHFELQASQRHFETMMNELLPDDAIFIMPSVIDLPPVLGSGTGLREPQRLWSLLGWPVISLPVCDYGGEHTHLSISVQLIAKPGQDLALLALARQIEQHMCS